jgi:hypothetical protein
MDLDMRFPIGLMFTLLGAILLATGLVDSAPIDAWAGGGMFAFGAVALGSMLSRTAPSVDRHH